jgi:predicted nucleic acid-binding protein
VVDASAGAEIVAKTARGERLAALISRGSRRDILDHFTVETAGVVRRWELSGKLTRDQAAAALSRLVRWPGYRLTGTDRGIVAAAKQLATAEPVVEHLFPARTPVIRRGT